MKHWLLRISALALLLLGFAVLAGEPKQESSPGLADEAPIEALIDQDGERITIRLLGARPKPPVFYKVDIADKVSVGPERVEHAATLDVGILQGEEVTISLRMRGAAEVTAVRGSSLESWSVRREGSERFLDIRVRESEQKTHRFEVAMRSAEYELPAALDITHFAPGPDTAGFSQSLLLQYEPGIRGSVAAVQGFLPVDGEELPDRFQTGSGGRLHVELARSGTLAGPVELSETRLEGRVHPDGRSVRFTLRGSAQVTEAEAELALLRGNAAFSAVPAGKGDYRLRLDLDPDGEPVYRLIFPLAGAYGIELEFVAAVAEDKDWRSMGFELSAGAVAPIILRGIDADSEFRTGTGVVPRRRGEVWQGFIPASGRCELAWKDSRKVDEGTLFFSTLAHIETALGAGLLRQDHYFDYRVLQGELAELTLAIDGAGEVLDVQGSNVVAWQVSDGESKGTTRSLEVKLSQPITEASRLHVRTQTPLDAFPVRVQAMRLTPQGAVRHSGFIRLSNQGSVRIEPVGLTGLTQLAQDQLPGKALEARQVFVYRFPAADYALELAADRIQPEVNVSQLVVYRLAESDRVISADIELDIREAPIRETDLLVPAHYSVVTVQGTAVADYVVGSEILSETPRAKGPGEGIQREAGDGPQGESLDEPHDSDRERTPNETRTATGNETEMRNLKVLFNRDLSGRQLISVQLEKNEPAVAGDWILPRLAFPGAKSVRGDIGIAAAPGLRIAVRATDLLAEKPLSYFPKQTKNLQQAFRIRDPAWSATLQIELLSKSIQADVLHLYSLSEGTAYGSVLLNYLITGAPVSDLQLSVPASLENLMVEGQDVRTWRREAAVLSVSLHQPVIGSYTLLLTFEEQLIGTGNALQAGRVTPLEVQGESGYLQVVSPMPVKVEPAQVSDGLLPLDALELPAEFRLLSSAPSLGLWQYTERPFQLDLDVDWFEPGSTLAQVVEFAQASSRVSADGELVTDLVYDVKSRGNGILRLGLPTGVRLWSVGVGGQSVTARQAGEHTLIPLPGGTDPNQGVEVHLRLGKPAADGGDTVLALPVVSAPVLKTQWSIHGDGRHRLVPTGGTVQPPHRVLSPSGLTWLAGTGLGSFAIIAFLAGAGIWLSARRGLLKSVGLLGLLGAIAAAILVAQIALESAPASVPIDIALAVLMPGQEVRLQVASLPLWMANLSLFGIFIGLLGIAGLVRSFIREFHGLYRIAGTLLLVLGLLLQHGSAPWFFLSLAFALVVLVFVPRVREWIDEIRARIRNRRETRRKRHKAREAEPSETGSATLSIALLVGTLALFAALPDADAKGAIPEGFAAADIIEQKWKISEEKKRLRATGTLRISGEPGEGFLLLKAPAVLTSFTGKGLRLAKQEVAGIGLAYIVAIADRRGVMESLSQAIAPDIRPSYEAAFEYLLEVTDVAVGFPLPTGPAAVQRITVGYDRKGWELVSPGAVRIEPLPAAADGNESKARLLLGPQGAHISLKPETRDVTTEESRFFVETSNLYLPGPGVVDGRHRLHVRPSRGQVKRLSLRIPEGLTVSEVRGPVGSWQFDADTRVLRIAVEPAKSQTFDLFVDTQGGLDPLPAELVLSPLRIQGAAGEVGLLALAFGPDAQPEKATSDTLSAVNLGDFDATLLSGEQATLHRVYRYGTEGGSLHLRVAPVAPEVRVTAKQVLSLGDERVVLGIDLLAEITRAGLFQLSFPLPEGLEVESLTGDALHHWAELTEGEQRRIVLHLNGKTLGSQGFALTLTGPAPADEGGSWELPRFEFSEATRQTGELVVRPTTGIRLSTVSRQNVSEMDPRALGGEAKGALAFRLLQRDWSLVLGVERLEPWITGQVLHEVTLREGQTRTALMASFSVDNASIRKLRVHLPLSGEDEIKTLRASGAAVSDLVRIDPDASTWELRLKRHVVGDLMVRIEYERRGDRVQQTETLARAVFPAVRQIAYYVAVRAGGRLDLEPGVLPRGWQRADWQAVPQSLRDAGNRAAPTLTLRSVAPQPSLAIGVRRHLAAEALKLRVTQGTLTSVLSSLGAQLTAVDLTMDVVQRSSLTLGLPPGAELFSIFVNDESVHFVRRDQAWQFYVLPGADDGTARLQLVYSVPGDALGRITLTSPSFSVPLEDIQWQVIAPRGVMLVDADGDLEPAGGHTLATYDRRSYLGKAQQQRRERARQAAQLLDRANKDLQAGEQTKARSALKSVANQYALDAASNEDARVQLESLQTQQAVVGLNTRRQRLYLDNSYAGAGGTEQADQLVQGASSNRVLQEGDLNFRPQEMSSLLQGNTREDNAVLQRIASRLVQQQRAAEPAPQTITIIRPEEGTRYSFARTVQVAQNAPLELELTFASVYRLELWRILVVLAFLGGLAMLLAAPERHKDS